MKIIVVKDYEELSKYAANRVIETIQNKPSSVLGMATGGTPIGMYNELVEEYNKGNVDFSNVTSFNLDEYVGLAPEHPQSYHSYMHQHLFQHINLPSERAFIPDGSAGDLQEECRIYEQRLREAGGTDLQILGIGTNGHIGFNEPGAEYDSKTRIVPLAESTIEANARFFDHIDQVPKSAITMGIESILKSRQIMVLASGEGKADIVKQIVQGSVTPQIPASYLKRHKDVTWVLDEEASQLLDQQDLNGENTSG